MWNNDTVLAITKPQLIKINRSLNDYAHLTAINQTLYRDLVLSDSLCRHWKRVALKMDTLFLKEQQKCGNINNINVSLQKDLENEKKKKQKTCIGVGVGGALFGILLGVLLSK